MWYNEKHGSKAVHIDSKTANSYMIEVYFTSNQTIQILIEIRYKMYSDKNPPDNINRKI
jgi:hypothetical protein